MISHEPRWWRVLPDFAFNTSLGAAYLDVVRQGKLMFWEFSQELHQYSDWVALSAMLLVFFHCWVALPTVKMER